MNVKDKEKVVADSKVVELEVKDGMKRIGFQRDASTKQKYDREFIKVVNPHTAEYITVYPSDLEGKVLTNQRFRATVSQDPSHPANRRSVEVDHKTFNELYEKLSDVNFEKLHNNAKKKSVVLGEDKHTQHNSEFKNSAVSNLKGSVSKFQASSLYLPPINSNKQPEKKSQPGQDSNTKSNVPKLPDLNSRGGR